MGLLFGFTTKEKRMLIDVARRIRVMKWQEHKAKHWTRVDYRLGRISRERAMREAKA